MGLRRSICSYIFLVVVVVVAPIIHHCMTRHCLAMAQPANFNGAHEMAAAESAAREDDE